MLIALAAAALCTAPAAAQQITFKQAIDLALKRSGIMAIAAADQVRAHENYVELRSAYIPSVTLGSGLGYQVGVPLATAGSAPSLFNITTQQFILNFAQHDFIRAAKTEWKASDLDMQDKRNQVIMDTAILYSELTTVLGKLRSLHEQQQAATHSEFISSERRKEGLESELDVKRAQLTRAKVAVRLAQSEGDADVLRDRLSKLMGVPAAGLELDEKSLPGAPEVHQDADLAKIAAAISPVALLSDAHAKAAELRARAEGRVLFPSIDFGTQYARLASFNNYDEFYRKFTKNNYTFGAEIRFPILNFAQRARAASARAEAVKAKRQADDVRAQISSDTLRLQRSVRQLSAMRDVTRLEYEISFGNFGAVQTRIQSGGATSADYEQARIDTGDKYVTYLDANLDLYRAQVQLMRATGELENWIATVPKP